MSDIDKVMQDLGARAKAAAAQLAYAKDKQKKMDLAKAVRAAGSCQTSDRPPRARVRRSDRARSH